MAFLAAFSPLLGILAKFFLGLFVKAHPSLSPEAVAAADAASAHITAAISTQAATTETAIAKAEANAPSSKANVINTLDKGKF